MREPFEVPIQCFQKFWLAPSCVQTWWGCYQPGSNIYQTEYGSPFPGRSIPHQPMQPPTKFSDFFPPPPKKKKKKKKNLNKEQGCEGSDFNLISRFFFFGSTQNPIFRLFNAVWMHWKAHLFRHFRLFQTFFLTDALTPLKELNGRNRLIYLRTIQPLYQG